MRLFVAYSRHSQQPSSFVLAAASTRPTSRSRSSNSFVWSFLCFIVTLNSFLSILSPSTAGGKVSAALDPGFCGDCQTFSNAIGVCGGTFGPTDIEISGEYVLQQAYSKCICTDVMQKVLWTCAKCELLAGHQSKAPPPQKYQTQCIAWGMTIDEWKAPYTGPVAPGTQTDVGNGGTNPTSPSSPASSTAAIPSTPKTSSGGATPTGGNGNDGGKGSGASDPAQPSSSSNNSEAEGEGAAETTSGPNTTAIGISVGIIGIAVVAGVMAVVMMKRRRRRRTPLDLDSLPAQTNFATLENKWEKLHPGSPSSPPAHVASATPAISRVGHRSPYEASHGYADEGVVNGYDGPYDGYDHYGNGSGGGAYDGYSHGQYNGQYSKPHYVGYHPGRQQDAYPMRDYGFEHNAPNGQAPPFHAGVPSQGERGKF
ncbi:hypothetical protein BGZ98_005561 [Dissophora globulifera]|nr:hypothetical protein BGZ98_005561 [Dissophora globulifera]